MKKTMPSKLSSSHSSLKKDASKFKLEPPEGGWGWMVALGMTIMFNVVASHLPSFGILFAPILRELGQGTAGATLVTNLMNAAFNFAGLVTNHLLKSYTYREVAVIGSLVATVGLFLTAFARSMVHIIITYGILLGVGFGIIAPASFMAMNSYFFRRRGFAMGLSMAGNGLGLMLFPILCQLLLDEYSFRGAVLVLSAICLNSIVGAILFQPIEWHMKRVPIEDVEEHGQNGLAESKYVDVDKGEEQCDVTNQANKENEEANESVNPLLGRTTSCGSLKPRTSVNFGSGMLAFDTAVIEIGNKYRRSKRTKTAKTVLTRISNFFDLWLLKDWSYVNIVLGLSIAIISEVNFFIILPFFLRSLEFAPSEIALCMTIMAAADIVSRLVLPSLGDYFKLKKRTSFMLGCFFSGVVRSVMALFSDFISVAVIVALVGLLRGTLIVNISLTVAEHCRLEDFPAAYSLYMVINGIIALVLGPFVGVIRDATGSYSFCIHVLSAILFVCAISWLLEMIILRNRNTKEETTKDLEVTETNIQPKIT